MANIEYSNTCNLNGYLTRLWALGAYKEVLEIRKALDKRKYTVETMDRASVAARGRSMAHGAKVRCNSKN